MPRPVAEGHRYVAGLDGIRALAVLAVIAYHVNAPWARGGMLGVGVFFTLSGYLITDLLLEQWQEHGDLGLGVFWLRRARRLLPALFVILIAVSVWVALFDASQLAAVRRQVVSAVLYVNNWVTIAEHGSYFARFANPLPLDHLWSLAIEEQFYLLWPFLLLVGILWLRRRWLITLAILAGVAASAVAMGALYHRGYDPSRVYEGTDTRAFALLIGAALAAMWPTRALRRSGQPANGPESRRAAWAGRAGVRVVLDIVGTLGLAGVIVLVWRTDSFSPFLYPVGFVLLSVATGAMLLAVVNPGSWFGLALGCAPLRFLGVRSYGMYLWQWPIVVLAGSSENFDAGRALLEIAGTVLIASISWRYIEEPIRHGALERLIRARRFGAGRRHARRLWLALSGAAAASLAVCVAGLAGVLPVASAGIRNSTPKLRAVQGLPAQAVRQSGAQSEAAAPLPSRTACKSVVYIGDSTSEGETSTDYIPNARMRLPAQLRDVGVHTTFPEISGARSIIETFQGQPNAATVAKAHLSSGFHGCWIIAMGTNDVDNFHDGGPGFTPRIKRMMSIIGNQPALWVDVVTLLGSGPYEESAMQRWNRALLAACARYPTMRVFDWAHWAKRRWFIRDGIHYYSPGYIARAHDIARGLANAFPAGRPPAGGCVVR